MPKQFTAEASILIEPQRTQVSDLQAISPDSGDVGGLVRTQIDILHSPALLHGVVEALHLTDIPEFEPKGGGLMFLAKTLLQKYGLLPTPEVYQPTQQDLVEIAAGGAWHEDRICQRNPVQRAARDGHHAGCPTQCADRQ